MTDGHWYTLLELSKLVMFNVTNKSAKALVNMGLVVEKEGKYKTTQTDLFSTA